MRDECKYNEHWHGLCLLANYRGEDFTVSIEVFKGARQTIPSTKLSNRLKQIHVITSDISLGQVDNGRAQGLFTVMVGRLLRHITSQLSNLKSEVEVNHRELATKSHDKHLQFLVKLSFEAAKQNLSLTGLESIHN